LPALRFVVRYALRCVYVAGLLFSFSHGLRVGLRLLYIHVRLRLRCRFAGSVTVGVLFILRCGYVWLLVARLRSLRCCYTVVGWVWRYTFTFTLFGYVATHVCGYVPFTLILFTLWTFTVARYVTARCPTFVFRLFPVGCYTFTLYVVPVTLLLRVYVLVVDSRLCPFVCYVPVVPRSRSPRLFGLRFPVVHRLRCCCYTFGCIYAVCYVTCTLRSRCDTARLRFYVTFPVYVWLFVTHVARLVICALSLLRLRCRSPHVCHVYVRLLRSLRLRFTLRDVVYSTLLRWVAVCRYVRCDLPSHVWFVARYVWTLRCFDAVGYVLVVAISFHTVARLRCVGYALLRSRTFYTLPFTLRLLFVRLYICLRSLRLFAFVVVTLRCWPVCILHGYAFARAPGLRLRSGLRFGCPVVTPVRLYVTTALVPVCCVRYRCTICV